MIVHLNGWPGVGKYTVGKCLAARLGARLIHNHILHDVAIVCCGLNNADRWPLYETVRSAAYDALAARPMSEMFVMTNALCENSPREEKEWNEVVKLAARRGAPLVPIVLEVDLRENQRRIASPERSAHKLNDPELLASLVRSATIQKPSSPDLLVLDVPNLTPEQSAEAIHRHVESRGRA